jgi:hypothetical protein
MSDPTEEFFDQLGRQERLPKNTNGSIRFDLEHDGGIDHWFVAIINGAIRVSREDRGADTVIRTDRVVFERMARGETRPLAAWLRTDIVCDGQFRFVALLVRLFPQPPGARHPRAFAREHGWLK